MPIFTYAGVDPGANPPTIGAGEFQVEAWLGVGRWLFSMTDADGNPASLPGGAWYVELASEDGLTAYGRWSWDGAGAQGADWLTFNGVPSVAVILGPPALGTRLLLTLVALVPEPIPPPCDPWLLAAECPALPPDLDPAVLDWAKDAAQDMLWSASGRQYGVCTVTEAFTAGTGDCSVPWGTQAAMLGPTELPGLVVGVPVANDCCALRLRHPALAVNAVWIDGETLPFGSWTLTPDSRLLTADGSCWPVGLHCEGPRINVEYRWGVPPPPLAAGAMTELVTELVKGCTGDASCRLPTRVVSLARQGVQMAFLDPQTYLNEGRLGLPVCDLFIGTANPHGTTIPPGVRSPDFRVGGDVVRV